MGAKWNTWVAVTGLLLFAVLSVLFRVFVVFPQAKTAKTSSHRIVSPSAVELEPPLLLENILVEDKANTKNFEGSLLQHSQSGWLVNLVGRMVKSLNLKGNYWVLNGNNSAGKGEAREKPGIPRRPAGSDGFPCRTLTASNQIADEVIVENFHLGVATQDDVEANRTASPSVHNVRLNLLKLDVQPPAFLADKHVEAILRGLGIVQSGNGIVFGGNNRSLHQSRLASHLPQLARHCGGLFVYGSPLLAHIFALPDHLSHLDLGSVALLGKLVEHSVRYVDIGQGKEGHDDRASGRNPLGPVAMLCSLLGGGVALFGGFEASRRLRTKRLGHSLLLTGGTLYVLCVLYVLWPILLGVAK